METKNNELTALKLLLGIVIYFFLTVYLTAQAVAQPVNWIDTTEVVPVIELLEGEEANDCSLLYSYILSQQDSIAYDYSSRFNDDGKTYPRSLIPGYAGIANCNCYSYNLYEKRWYFLAADQCVFGLDGLD